MDLDRRPRIALRLTAAVALTVLVAELSGASLAGLVRAPSVPPAAASRAPTDLLPAELVAFVEIEGAGRYAEGFLESDLWARVQETRLYQEFRQSPEFLQVLGGLGFVELVTGRPAVEAIALALGERAAGGLVLDDGGQPGLVAALELVDADTAAEVLGVVVRLVETDDPGRVERGTHRGIERLAIDGRLFLVQADRFLVAASSNRLLRAALDRATDGASASFTGSALLEACRGARSSGAQAGWAIDLARVRAAQPADGGFPDTLKEPLLALLYGDLRELLVHAPVVSGEWHLTEDGASLLARLPAPEEEVAARLAAFGLDGPSGPGLPALATAGAIASLSLRRDLGEFWWHREALADPAAEKQFAELESGLGVFFGGRSLGEDVLAQLHDELALVVTRQSFEGRQTPKIRYPAGALVVRPREPERFVPWFAAAFHSFLALVNVQRGQEGHAPWLLETQPFAGTTVYGVRVLEEEARAADPAQANLSPALAQVGPWMVLATTRELLEQLVTQLTDPLEGPGDPQHSGRLDPAWTARLRIDAAALGEILEDNLEAFVAQRLLETGAPRAEAEAFVRGLIELSLQFEGLQIGTRREQGSIVLEASLRLAPHTSPTGSGPSASSESDA